MVNPIDYVFFQNDSSTILRHPRCDIHWLFHQTYIRQDLPRMISIIGHIHNKDLLSFVFLQACFNRQPAYAMEILRHKAMFIITDIKFDKALDHLYHRYDQGIEDPDIRSQVAWLINTMTSMIDNDNLASD